VSRFEFTADAIQTVKIQVFMRLRQRVSKTTFLVCSLICLSLMVATQVSKADQCFTSWPCATKRRGKPRGFAATCLSQASSILYRSKKPPLLLAFSAVSEVSGFVAYALQT
jgi:hypothetical protein